MALNVIAEVLDWSKFGDGIKPEYNQHGMSELIALMPEIVFEKWIAALEKAASVEQIMKHDAGNRNVSWLGITEPENI